MRIPSGTILDGIPLFEGFTTLERTAMAVRGRMTEVPAGHMLMREGEHGDTLYVLAEGSVRILRRDPAGNQVELARRHAGECFGEMALIDGGLRSATVITATPARLFELKRDVFLEVVAPSPVLLSKLLRELSRKIRDASERLVREDMNARLRAAEAELARHRAIVQAVTGLAHEMNTPLGICVTTASHMEILAEAGDEAMKEPAALLRANLGRAVALVEAFTAIAAPSPGEQPQWLDLADVCEQTAALYAMENPTRPLAVTLADRDRPRPWRGLRGPLERALGALFDNCASHAYPGQTGGRVTITITRAGDGRGGTAPAPWTVQVADHGIGIPPEAMPKLFDAFFTTARNRGHKGLGLTIVYNTVCGPLGGRVAVAPTPGGGATVSLTLPDAG